MTAKSRKTPRMGGVHNCKLDFRLSVESRDAFDAACKLGRESDKTTILREFAVRYAQECHKRGRQPSSIEELGRWFAGLDVQA